MKREKKRYSLRNRIIQYNLVLMISALILCGFIFMVSVGIIVGSYIQSDFDFLMTATADTVENSLSYCTDVVTNVRKSEILMNYLRKPEEGSLSEEEKDIVRKEFEKQVSISSQSITGTGGFPLVEKIYLFVSENQYLSSTYHVLTYVENEKSDRIFREIYQKHQMAERDYGHYIVDEKRIGVIFPVLNQQMEKTGDLFYQVEASAIRHLMAEIEKYEESFWILCDKEGKEIFGENEQIFENGKGRLLEKFSEQPFEIKLLNKNYQVYRKSVGMNLELFMGIPQDQFYSLMYDSVKIYAAAIALIAAAACLLLVFAIYRMTRPIQEVAEKLSEVRAGKFDTKLPEYDSTEFWQISLAFNEMTAYVEHLIKQVYEKQLSIKDMEMKFLQTQMNPHFMFNVLNTIALQAQLDGNLELHRMISSFNQLIQAKIYRDTSEKVKISQELEYVNYYLYLQNYRFGERLNYEIKIQKEELTEYYIPKLCIQLIVENAVVHGIEPYIGKGLVRISIYEEQGDICIDTEDNGVGFGVTGEIFLPMSQAEGDANHNHVGLNNAHHIIRLMYGDAYGIRVFSNSEGGSRICIRIPFDDGNQKKVSENV